MLFALVNTTPVHQCPLPCDQVGDVVRVHDMEEFPADLVVLSSAHEEGLCYADTSNLDGEISHRLSLSALPEQLVGASEQRAVHKSWQGTRL